MYIYFKFYILTILFIYIYNLSKNFFPLKYTLFTKGSMYQKRKKKNKRGNQTVPESFVILPKIKKCMTGFLFPANAATYRLLKSYWDECEPTNSKNKSDL